MTGFSKLVSFFLAVLKSRFPTTKISTAHPTRDKVDPPTHTHNHLRVAGALSVDGKPRRFSSQTVIWCWETKVLLNFDPRVKKLVNRNNCCPPDPCRLHSPFVSTHWYMKRQLLSWLHAFPWRSKYEYDLMLVVSIWAHRCMVMANRDHQRVVISRRKYNDLLSGRAEMISVFLPVIIGYFLWIY